MHLPLIHGWSGISGRSLERYADDAVVHCVSKEQAEQVLAASPSGWKRWA